MDGIWPCKAVCFFCCAPAHTDVHFCQPQKKQLMPRITFVVKFESNLAGRTYGVVLRRPGTPGRVGIPVGRLLVPEEIFF